MGPVCVSSQDRSCSVWAGARLRATAGFQGKQNGNCGLNEVLNIWKIVGLVSIWWKMEMRKEKKNRQMEKK